MVRIAGTGKHRRRPVFYPNGGRPVGSGLYGGSLFDYVGYYVKRGFVRLLGLGHLIAWVPQIVWYIQMVGDAAVWFRYWLISIIIVNGLSLVIDFVDVVRYSLGDRQPL